MPLTGLLGYGIRKSPSPRLHNRCFLEMGLAGWHYGLFDVPPDGVTPFVQSISRKEFAGVNVTMPYKQAVMSLLKRVGKGARTIGAVNTIVNVGGALCGENTDWLGITEAIRETEHKKNWSTGVVLGTGGTARAAIYALQQIAVGVVFVLGRDYSKALRLAEEASGWFGNKVSAIGRKELPIVGGASLDALLISTVPPAGQEWACSVIHAMRLSKGSLALDVLYEPDPSPFQKAVRAKKCPAIGGGRMLLHQAAASLRIWTGVSVPPEIMENALREAMAEIVPDG